MKQRITMGGQTLASAFSLFCAEKKAFGAVKQTLASYRAHCGFFLHYFGEDFPPSKLTDKGIQECILSLIDGKRKANTIRSYTVHWQAFVNWMRREEYTTASVKLYKGEDTVPDLYTNEELRKLLRKPKASTCTFSEYRNWVIVNVLVNNGIRASSIRMMLNEDIDLANGLMYIRHMKTRKAIALPIGDALSPILEHYMGIRGGAPGDYLFPTRDNEPFTESGLRRDMERYNDSRGVHKHGLHRFRHTFARMYLVECQGDALKLQRLLGHSTLRMTEHYLQLYDTDLILEYADHSPLAMLSKKEKLKMRNPGGATNKAGALAKRK